MNRRDFIKTVIVGAAGVSVPLRAELPPDWAKGSVVTADKFEGFWPEGSVEIEIKPFKGLSRALFDSDNPEDVEKLNQLILEGYRLSECVFIGEFSLPLDGPFPTDCLFIGHSGIPDFLAIEATLPDGAVNHEETWMYQQMILNYQATHPPMTQGRS